MKLPDDPKEKLKILVLVGIGAVAVLYTLIALVVKPLFDEKARCKAELATLSDELSSSSRDMERMLKERPGNTRALQAILDVSNRRGDILHPRLGNYELGAREYVERMSQACGVPVESMREIGLTQIPQPVEGGVDRTLKCYNMRITLACGMHEAVSLIQHLESSNPHLCVTSFSISTRSDQPGRHDINVDLQWPVWVDPGMAETLEQRLEEALAYTPPSRTARPAVEEPK